MKLFTFALMFVLLIAGEAYNPLSVSSSDRPEWRDLSLLDKQRERQIPVRVYLPFERSPKPVIIFSPGLGGSREGYSYLGRHWAGRGYVCFFLQHQGSDEQVWKNKGLLSGFRAMKKAASVENLQKRIADVHFLVNSLSVLNDDKNHFLYGRLVPDRVGMSGHSFGAVTAQAVSGQSYDRYGQMFTIPQIKAAVIFSPSLPRQGEKPEAAFTAVRIPWFLITGTRDVAAIGNVSVDNRLAVFPALPPGGKYELLLHDAQHAAFTERMLLADERNPNHHRAILAITTSFWDLYLAGKAEAELWLNGNGVLEVLEKADRWQKK